MCFSWAMIPIGNILTARYSFIGLFTALNENLQLENEFKMASASANTYHQQYINHAKFVQKHGNPTHSISKPRAPVASGSFADIRRKVICHLCKKQCNAGHFRQPGSIRSYVRDSLKNRDAAVHIVSELLHRMEGELEEKDTSSEARGG